MPQVRILSLGPPFLEKPPIQAVFLHLALKSGYWRDSEMKVICFGDSNTYGYDPHSLLGDRYDADSR